VVEGLEYLEKQQVAHLDLKMENILVDSNMDIKITDFGFSAINQKSIDAYGGTKSYMAPEILQRKSYDGFKADIFSFGVLLFITTIGNFPFVEASKSDKYYSLISQPDHTDEFW
jgi:serine/threonine protein kinase